MSDRLKKRTQAERLAVAETLISSVWEEIQNGIMDDSITQVAVNIQVQVNRIVFMLDERMNHTEDDA